MSGNFVVCFLFVIYNMYMMYKIFVVFVIGAIGFLFWRMGPGNDVGYYENRDTTKTEIVK